MLIKMSHTGGKHPFAECSTTTPGDLQKMARCPKENTQRARSVQLALCSWLFMNQ